MTTLSTPLLLATSDIEDDNEILTTSQNESGRDNRNFSNDDVCSVNVDFEQNQRTEIENDIHHRSFRQNSYGINTINNLEDSIASTNSPDTSENEQSHYEEVAANVSNKDDPSVSVLTFRSWFLGILFTCLLSFVNQFFWYRTSPLFVGTLVAQLLTYPLGRAMAKMLPTRQVTIFRWTFTLNPGPFTTKEHCIITAMANATCVSFTLHKTEYNTEHFSSVL
jgi:hypothetical protein